MLDQARVTRGIEDQLLERLNEGCGLNFYARYLAVHGTACINYGRLCQVVETLGAGIELKTKIATKCADGYVIAGKKAEGLANEHCGY